ncbi:hypothetical protein LTR53_000720 [Teratosphaeriaceae sp. CCFEE 6253]|nr:hypothetical protein LTR53_000720 [Teratosphaeriaceae sp. CCFEE 6253]
MALTNSDNNCGLDELAAPPADEPPAQGTSSGRRESVAAENRAIKDDEDEEERRESGGLDELEAGPPDQNPDSHEYYRRDSLEAEHASRQSTTEQPAKQSTSAQRLEMVWSEIYVHSYLVFFSMLGVLARLGLVALTTYPGAPLNMPIVWANVGGSLLMGFLREERMLFRRHWRTAMSKAQETAQRSTDDMSSSVDPTEEKKSPKTAASEAYVAGRSTVHGFIGLTVGFCGTFTSFADIIRDAFLAMSNDLDTAHYASQATTATRKSRPDGYSVMAVIAVIWIEVSMSLAALSLGGHLGIATHRWTDKLPAVSFERFMNKFVVFVGWGTWIGAVIMAIRPPHEAWRGQAVFAMLFAPVGAIMRFHLAKLLNRRIASFPLGTFAANVFGTCVLGMVWDLQHSIANDVVIPCQVLQGVGDGFCGALTTVSTWVLELKALRVRHAYVYAVLSLAISLACMIAIMGPLRWVVGFDMVTCIA